MEVLQHNSNNQQRQQQPQIPMDKESISMTADEQWIWMISTIFWQSIETNNMSHKLLDYNTTVLLMVQKSS